MTTPCTVRRTLLLVVALSACTSTRSATVIRRFPAAEANQGVAVDANFFYAIDNASVGKYDKRTGHREGGWQDTSGHVTHLDSGIVLDDELYCAHSNYPNTPMVSTIEVFETKGMTHLRSIPLPSGIGSATWVDRTNGDWWVTFANYAGNGGEPGKGPDHTLLVRFDPQWQRRDSWRFPAAVVSRWGEMSSSGGTWVPGKGLYTTGHDARELYVLDLPASGDELTLKRIIAFESAGQGIAIDRSDGLLYSIQRSSHEVIVSRLPNE